MRDGDLHDGWDGVCEGVSAIIHVSLQSCIWTDSSDRYHVERYLREVMIPRLAPVSREMCLNYIAEKVLDQPRSY